MPEAAKVAEALNATLVDMRFVKPLDDTLILEMAAQRGADAGRNAIMGGAGSGGQTNNGHRKPVRNAEYRSSGFYPAETQRSPRGTGA